MTYIHVIVLTTH